MVSSKIASVPSGQILTSPIFDYLTDSKPQFGRGIRTMLAGGSSEHLGDRSVERSLEDFLDRVLHCSKHE